jgi:uncharacterized protein GlcG (DUF336 family)
MTASIVGSTTRPTVSAEAARRMVDAALAEATGAGVPTTVVVVDESGVLKEMVRMDRAPLVSVQTAINKAYAAAAIGMPPDDFYSAIEADTAAVAEFGTRPGLALVRGPAGDRRRRSRRGDRRGRGDDRSSRPRNRARGCQSNRLNRKDVQMSPREIFLEWQRCMAAQRPEGRRVNPGPTLSCHGVGKRYSSTWALRDCTLRIPAGSVTALVGPNGAGNTTLLQLAAGMSAPTTGEIETLGWSPRRDSMMVVPRIGFLAQDRVSAGDHYATLRHPGSRPTRPDRLRATAAARSVLFS